MKLFIYIYTAHLIIWYQFYVNNSNSVPALRIKSSGVSRKNRGFLQSWDLSSKLGIKLVKSQLNSFEKKKSIPFVSTNTRAIREFATEYCSKW